MQDNAGFKRGEMLRTKKGEHTRIHSYLVDIDCSKHPGAEKIKLQRLEMQVWEVMTQGYFYSY